MLENIVVWISPAGNLPLATQMTLFLFWHDAWFKKAPPGANWFCVDRDNCDSYWLTLQTRLQLGRRLARQHLLGVASILSNASWCGGKVSDKNSLTLTVWGSRPPYSWWDTMWELCSNVSLARMMIDLEIGDMGWDSCPHQASGLMTEIIVTRPGSYWLIVLILLSKWWIYIDPICWSISWMVEFCTFLCFLWGSLQK